MVMKVFFSGNCAYIDRLNMYLFKQSFLTSSHTTPQYMENKRKFAKA